MFGGTSRFWPWGREFFWLLLDWLFPTSVPAELGRLSESWMSSMKSYGMSSPTPWLATQESCNDLGLTNRPWGKRCLPCEHFRVNAPESALATLCLPISRNWPCNAQGNQTQASWIWKQLSGSQMIQLAQMWFVPVTSDQAVRWLIGYLVLNVGDRTISFRGPGGTLCGKCKAHCWLSSRTLRITMPQTESSFSCASSLTISSESSWKDARQAVLTWRLFLKAIWSELGAWLLFWTLGNNPST